MHPNPKTLTQLWERRNLTRGAGPDSASLMFVIGGLVVAMSTSTSLHHPPSSLQRCCCSPIPAASQGCGSSSSRRGASLLLFDDSSDTFASPATPPPSLLLPATTTTAAVAVATVSEPSLPRHAAASSDNNKWWHRQQHAWSSTLLSRHDTVAANWLRTVASHTDGRSSAASIINTFLLAADADLAGTAAMRLPPSSRPTTKDTGVVVPSNTVVSKSGQTKSSLTTSTTPATTAAVAKVQAATTMTASATAATTSSTTSSKNNQSSSPDRPPTVNEVSQLQEALLLFYGTNPNLSLSYELLSQCILTWETTHQSTNEIASLYRIRGDINMGLVQFTLAESDYSKAIQYLQQQQGSRTPPENMKNNEYGEEEEEAKEEYTASLLGRARSIRARGSAASVIQASQASKDYETYFILTSNLDNDDTNPTTTTTANSKTNNNDNYNENDNSNNSNTNNKVQLVVLSDTIIDGIQHNPYAAWEWGMVNRVARQYNLAVMIHGLASTAFDKIGDPPRSVICFLDKGIDMALDLDTVSSGGGGGSNKGQQLAIVKDTLNIKYS